MNRMRGAHGVNERVEMTGGLLPQFLAQRQVAFAGIGIVQLVAIPMVASRADLRRLRDHRLDEGLVDTTTFTGNVGDVRTECLHRPPLLVAERIREYDLDRISFGGAYKRQGYAGGPRRVFDHS